MSLLFFLHFLLFIESNASFDPCIKAMEINEIKDANFFTFMPGEEEWCGVKDYFSDLSSFRLPATIYHNLDSFGLHVLLPEKCYIKSKEGDLNMFAFIVNNSTDSILISECDGTLDRKSQIQVNRNHIWQSHTRGAGPDCWTGCTNTYLHPHSYAVLLINFFDGGEVIHGPFRIKIGLRNGEIIRNYYSNSITYKCNDDPSGPSLHL